MMIITQSILLRAAQIFQSKNDVRSDLNGICINNDVISSGNGHAGILMRFEGSTGLKGTLTLSAKVPAAAVETHLMDGSAIHFDAKGQEKSRSAYTFVEHELEFNIEKVIPILFKIDGMPIPFQPKFMKQIADAFPVPKKGRCFTRLVHYDGGESPIVFEINTTDIPHCEPLVIVMPIKE